MVLSTQKKFPKKILRGFTLIEILMVIGILTVLGTIAVTILNPAESLRKSRDSRRTADLNSLSLSLADLGGNSMGSSSIVYVSAPDSSPICANLCLPSLGSGWSYACSDTDHYQKVDGTGWMPVNFSASTTRQSLLSNLPIDPINIDSKDLYYTYIANSDSWELSTLLESSSYRTKYLGLSSSTAVYILGNHQFGMSPNAIAARIGSGVCGVISTTTAPLAPQNLSATPGNQQAVLNWQAPSSDGGSAITNYKIYRGTSSGAETYFTTVGNVLNYTNTGLTNGTTYYYKVSAVNVIGEGSQSNEISATPTAGGIGSIDSIYKWAWNDSIGWISFGEDSVNVGANELSGYAYNSNAKEIALNCASTPIGNICGTSNFKVSRNSTTGDLAGWAWNDDYGWISFNCADPGVCGNSNYKVNVNPATGIFTGWAWNDYIGWISFNCADPGVCGTSDYKVATAH